MRSYQVFAAMSSDRASEVMTKLAEGEPQMFAQAVAVASAAMNARPRYLQRQPFAKRAEAVRRALARVAANSVAEELLAVYFLQCRKQILIEWLDALGIEHEDGSLKDDTPAAPAKATLEAAIAAFCGVDDDPDRQFLLRAFAAQSAIDWPDLEALIEGESER